MVQNHIHHNINYVLLIIVGLRGTPELKTLYSVLLRLTIKLYINRRFIKALIFHGNTSKAHTH